MAPALGLRRRGALQALRALQNVTDERSGVARDIEQALEERPDPNRATVDFLLHDWLQVERLCERVIIMKRGRIEDDDTPERLLARYGRSTLEEVFLDVARGRGEQREAAQ